MKTFEYRLYPNKAQFFLLLTCLRESRRLYNDMLEAVKVQYEQEGTFPTKYDLEKIFKGRSEHVPATTVQMLADRLSKSLKRFLAAKKNEIAGVGFPVLRHRIVGTPSNSGSMAKTGTCMKTRTI